MKKRANWLLISAVALSFNACKKKEAVQSPPMPPKMAETPTKEASPAIPEVKAAPKVSAEERAAKLGFAKYLPQDTEVVLAFHNGTKNVNRIKSSKLWKMIEKEMGGGMDEVVEEIEGAPEEQDAPKEADPTAADSPAEDEEPMRPAELFGEEFTLALGKTSSGQIGNLLTLGRRSNYFQMRAIAKAFAAAAKSGDMEQFTQSMATSMSSELMKDLLNDPQSGIGIVEKASMPPIYVAFKTKEKDREAAAQQVSGMMSSMAMLGEMVEPLSLEKAGSKFEGFKISGAKISEALAGERETFEKQLDSASVDRLIATLAKKDIVIVSGTIGDHVVLFIGGSAEDFKLASDAGQSILATDAIAFIDPYLSKDLAAVMYGEKQGMDTLISASGGLADVTNGLRDGLAGSDGLGDTRDLEALFQIIGEREAALRKLAGNEALGLVAFLEDGMKIESHGGYDSGMVDWKTPTKLAHLGQSEDVAMFANISVDAAFDQKARAYYESLLETAYTITLKVAESPIKDEKFEEFKQSFMLFDGKFRPEVTALWDIFSNDFSSSLGGEKAWVIDFKGAAPAIPGIPQKVVDEAKVPRISVISSVTDRAKLAGSWDKMNTTLTSSFAKISEITGNNIPMQKPMSTEKNGLTTWFFPMPFFNDDFLPSVTVGDQWFVASTSKIQSLDLIEKATAGGEVGNGLLLKVNFKALEKYSKETYKLVEENAEAVRGEPLSAEDKKNISSAISAMGTLDQLSIHGRRENSEMRTSVHFKVR